MAREEATGRFPTAEGLTAVRCDSMNAHKHILVSSAISFVLAASLHLSAQQPTVPTTPHLVKVKECPANEQCIQGKDFQLYKVVYSAKQPRLSKRAASADEPPAGVTEQQWSASKRLSHCIQWQDCTDEEVSRLQGILGFGQ